MLAVVIPKHLSLDQGIEEAFLVTVGIAGPLSFIQNDMERYPPFIALASLTGSRMPDLPCAAR